MRCGEVQLLRRTHGLCAWLQDSFIRFLERRAAVNKPFLAQIAYHNNHIPYVATAKARADCAAAKTCKPVSPSAGTQNDQKLSFS